MDKFFKLKERNTNLKTEGVAGVTTFLAMSYILVVNPIMLSQAGMDQGAVFTTTVISAIIGTLIMAFYANYPIGLAAGMGINSFFTFTVVLTLGYSWQEGLFAVFISGLIFVTISVTGFREKVINAIPSSLKYATSAGIGLFIAFIGLQQSGIVVSNEATLVGLGNVLSPSFYLALFGLAIMLFFTARKNNFAIILGIVATFILALVLNMFGVVTGQNAPESFISLPPSISPIFGQIFTVDVLSLITDIKFWAVVFTFLFIDFFDTTGTLIAVGNEAGLLDKDGKLKNGNKPLLADGIGTTIGAIFGTSSITSYVESLSGIKSGGRTGLTALVIAFMFFLSLFFSPIVTSIAAFVTAPALIMVGILMARNHLNIDYTSLANSASAFMTMLIMVTTYSIVNGIAIGFITYTLIKIFEGKFKDLNITLIVLDIVFIIYFTAISTSI